MWQRALEAPHQLFPPIYIRGRCYRRGIIVGNFRDHEQPVAGAPDLHAFDPLGAPLWEAPDAVRFVGAEGLAWRVVECAAGQVPGSRGPRCLVFLSEGLVRRVWDFPPDWRTLGPVALDALMARP